MKFKVIIFLAVLSFVACKQDQAIEAKDPVLTEIGGENYTDYLRTPVNPDGTLDSTKMPRIVFDKPIHNFGVLGQEDKKEHTFSFKNTSNHNLYVMNVNTSCGCTVASFSEDKIAPGESGEIKINYDPKNRSGLQEKKVIVTSNAYPNTTELTIIAEIKK